MAILSAREQTRMLEDLVHMTADGIAINVAIDELIRTSNGKGVDAAKAMKAALTAGQSMADGMRAWFEPILCDAVRSGMKMGEVEQSVGLALQVMKARTESNSQLLKSLIYPVFALIVGTALVLVYALYVLPMIASLIPREKWTPVGKLAFAVGNTIAHQGIPALVFIAMSVGFIVASLPRPARGMRSAVQGIPPWSLYRLYHSAAFMLQLSLLVESGIIIREAFITLRARANPYVRSHVVLMEQRLKAPGNNGMAGVLNTGLIAERDAVRLRVYEHSERGFEFALRQMGTNAAQRLTETLATVSKVATVLILSVSGALIGLMMVGLYTTLNNIV